MTYLCHNLHYDRFQKDVYVSSRNHIRLHSRMLHLKSGTLFEKLLYRNFRAVD